MSGELHSSPGPVSSYVSTECATSDGSLSFSFLESLSSHLLNRDKISFFSTLAGSGKIRYCPQTPYTKVLVLF